MTDNTNPINSVAPLANVARLTRLIDKCQNRTFGLPGMGCFFGRAGLGKTHSGIYATNAFNAVHVEAMPIGGVKGLLSMIVAELGMKPRKTGSDMFNQIAQELAVTGRPLIIDEADKILHDTPIEIIRRLHDVSGVAVILMGEESLPQQLQRWERVHSRMLSWVGAEPATLDDVGHLTKIYARGITLSDDLKAALLAASGGSIRNVSTNLANLSEYAALHGKVKLDLGEWGGQAFHTGTAPAPRNFAPKPARRGAAA
jgi:DNA transposition AAA+ family ATPase